MNSKKAYLQYGLFGLLLGFVLGGIGFGDYREVHKMFTFADVRMFLAFAGGVALSLAFFQLLPRRHKAPVINYHRGIIPGGLLFGTGWAISGGCPAVVLIQLGQGQMLAAITIAGLVLGTVLYPWVHKRFLGWDKGSCAQ